MLLDATLPESIARAAALLAQGELVVFPTETFYGIAASIDNARAIGRLARLKERDNKPIPLIAATRSSAERYVRITPMLAKLVDALWPGPLTIAALPHAPISSEILGGG